MTRPLLCLDHVLGYTGAMSIEDALAAYRTAGFAPMARTVRHAPGLRNGFIGLGPEYLELLWVEDEREFATGGPWRQAQRRARRPFAFALRTHDLHAVAKAWRACGVDPGEPSHGAPADVTGTPAWSFLHLPPQRVPGPACFVLRYHGIDDSMRGRVRVAPNGVYALAGLTFVAADPDGAAARWRDLLAPCAELDGERGERRFALGAHALAWRTPEAFARRYAAFAAARELTGEIAVVHLLSDDLDLTEATLRRTGRAPRRAPGPELYVPADPRDGFAFAISPQPAIDWVAWRHELTGEPVSLIKEAA